MDDEGGEGESLARPWSEIFEPDLAADGERYERARRALAATDWDEFESAMAGASFEHRALGVALRQLAADARGDRDAFERWTNALRFEDAPANRLWGLRKLGRLDALVELLERALRQEGGKLEDGTLDAETLVQGASLATAAERWHLVLATLQVLAEWRSLDARELEWRGYANSKLNHDSDAVCDYFDAYDLAPSDSILRRLIRVSDSRIRDDAKDRLTEFCRRHEADRAANRYFLVLAWVVADREGSSKRHRLLLKLFLRVPWWRVLRLPGLARKVRNEMRRPVT